ncbi:hypothetical protein L195_g010735 [Trifolium pratense]|uniref:Uncharacterized protein n=1 Tax=Trifolium pratense TaxID=57577 RepID=A0A2K3PFI7_TRIPR|nr:hypothetical protein L195_g010735 [Trifolium pratense]
MEMVVRSLQLAGFDTGSLATAEYSGMKEALLWIMDGMILGEDKALCLKLYFVLYIFL